MRISNKKNFKKSQMEIMGLAIVIVLVILGMLFVVKFVMNREPPKFRAEFTQTQLASNMLNTFLKSNSKDCSDMSITELLQSCAQTEILCDNNQLSCAYVETAAGYVFSKTLEEWNLKYHFLVYIPNQNSIINLGTADLTTGCPGEKKSKIYPIPTTVNTLYTRLDICS